MKKRYLIIGLLASSTIVSGQKQDSSYRKQHLSHTDVQMLFSYYNQDNNHSAVTGGIGTEALSVYAPQLSLNYIKDSVRTVHYDFGVDVISSASTDNIDYAISSASKVDNRMHTSLGYTRNLNKRSTLGVNTYASVESDYFSFGPSFAFNTISKDLSREISVSTQVYLDDQRWGWYNNGRPQKLIYPVELRNKQWFDVYKRNSFNFLFGLYQTINKRMALGVYPGVSYQSGLLSTPFHRVYFADGAERVESLPLNRLKVPVGIQLNMFVGSRTVVRVYYRYYWDDFGIKANTFSIETPYKVLSSLTLTPFIRLYQQTQARYFQPYKEHLTKDAYYTSDYDLSKFTSVKPGLAIRYAPYLRKNNSTIKEVEVRYSHYKRSDGLHANMISLYFNYDVDRKLE